MSHPCLPSAFYADPSPFKVTDVTSDLIRCYETDTASSTNTATVSAGATVGFQADSDFYHPGVSTVIAMCQLQRVALTRGDPSTSRHT